MSEKKTQIIDAALRLFADEGVAVSTANIAKAAGVSNGTLFNHYPTKQELLDALFRHVKMQMIEAMSPEAELGTLYEILRASWLGYFRWAKANPNAHFAANVLVDSGMISDHVVADINDQFSRLAQPLKNAIAAGEIVDMPFEFLATMILRQLGLSIRQSLDEAQTLRVFDMVWKSLQP